MSLGRQAKRAAITAASGWCILAGAAAAQPGPNADRALERMMAGESYLQGAELERALQAAAAHPFGSLENPVRAAMPQGQRAYLARLRCSNGQAPRFNRSGNAGAGVYGNIIDRYDVSCGESAPGNVTNFMDMYHRGHVEERAVPGFTITPSRPASRSPAV
jgi:hypothetical protein